jgi:hypothetical protein
LASGQIVCVRMLTNSISYDIMNRPMINPVCIDFLGQKDRPRGVTLSLQFMMALGFGFKPLATAGMALTRGAR